MGARGQGAAWARCRFSSSVAVYRRDTPAGPPRRCRPAATRSVRGGPAARQRAGPGAAGGRSCGDLPGPAAHTRGGGGPAAGCDAAGRAASAGRPRAIRSWRKTAWRRPDRLGPFPAGSASGPSHPVRYYLPVAGLSDREPCRGRWPGCNTVGGVGKPSPPACAGAGRCRRGLRTPPAATILLRCGGNRGIGLTGQQTPQWLMRHSVPEMPWTTHYGGCGFRLTQTISAPARSPRPVGIDACSQASLRGGRGGG